MGRVQELGIIWQRRIDSRGRCQQEIKHVVSLKDFLNELEILRSIVFTKELNDAVKSISKACRESDISDSQGRWRKNPSAWDDLPPPNYAAGVNRLLRTGMSKREAFATVASDSVVQATSWDAAIQKVKRFWEREQAHAAEVGLDRSGSPRNP